MAWPRCGRVESDASVPPTSPRPHFQGYGCGKARRETAKSKFAKRTWNVLCNQQNKKTQCGRKVPKPALRLPCPGLSHSLATGYLVSGQLGQGRSAGIILQELGLSPKVRINMSFPGSGSVYSMTIKPSTRSARSIAVTSVLKLWRHGGRKEPPIWLRPTAGLGSQERPFWGAAQVTDQDYVLGVDNGPRTKDRGQRTPTSAPTADSSTDSRS